MGNSSSTGGESNPELMKYWRDAVASAKNVKDLGCGQTVGGYTGGHMVGGIDDLTAEYDTTVSSKAKRDLIKNLSDGISKALRIPPPGSGASNDDMVAHLMKIVPNPRKGKSIIADKDKQGKLCQDVADVINKNYGNVIDKSLGPEGVCNQVSDIIESLSAGLNNEYVAVAASVERSLNNLKDLREMLDRSYSKLHEEASGSDDDSLKMNITGIRSVHDLLLKEVDRQIAILSNLTRTNLKDTDKDIASLLSDNKDFKGLVSSIKSSMGTSEWGDKLGFWLAGVNNVAQMALRVDKALKIIGMKASDYKQASKLSDLTMKTHELMEKMPAGKLTHNYISKYEDAIEILKKHHGHHEEIAPQVKGAYQSTFQSAPSGGVDFEDSFGAHGGVETLKKKLETQNRTRLLLLRDFKAKCTVLMDRVYNAIFNVGRRIGSGNVKLTDDLYRFKTNLSDMSSIFKDGIEYALTGYYTNAAATQHKDRFMGLLKSMLMVLEQLKSQDESFREVASNIEAVIKLIDFFNDKFNVHTGHTASELTGRGETEGAGLRGSLATGIGKTRDALNVIEQGVAVVDGAHEGGGEFKAAVTLKNAHNTFDHFYSVAKFKTNLKVASSEMKRYDEKYTEIVGSAVGRQISVLNEECNDNIKKLGIAHGTGATLNAGYKESIIAGSESTLHAEIGLKQNKSEGVYAGEWGAEPIKQMLTAQLEAKKKLYKVAQAVDLYLQKFTDAVATSPDDIQEVSKLLGSVEIMANWFDEKSGDSIASLYEVFPWTIVGFRTFMNTGLQIKTCGEYKKDSTDVRTRIVNGTHYYQCVSSTYSESDAQVAKSIPDYIELAHDGKGLPGVPFFPISPARAVFATKFAKYTVDKVYVLKNIVSAFAYLGRKFGGEDLATTGTFMSPNDMYKCLSEYLYMSAFTHGWGGEEYTRFYGRTASDSSNMKMDIYQQPTGYTPVLDYETVEKGFTGYGSEQTSSPSFDDKNLGFRIGPYLDTAATWGGKVSELDGKGLDDDKDNLSNITKIVPSTMGDGFFVDKLTLFKQTCQLRHDYSFTMSGIGDFDAKGTEKKCSLSGWKNEFKEEDKIFIIIIKAMAAKVFTVTGLYNMLNFGSSSGISRFSLSPARLVLGGGKSAKGGDSYTYDTPVIYPEAVELYARLPLLAEFYRDIFCFENPCRDDGKEVDAEETALLISMVPEVGSMWAGFIQTIFTQPADANGLYTDNVLKRLVHEINGIFKSYKDKTNATQAVISDFIAEINNRYGLMNRSEIKNYTGEEETRRTASVYGESTDLEDFDTLDSDNMGTGVAPSDRYVKIDWTPGLDAHNLSDDMYKALGVFRRRIDKRIASVVLQGTQHTDGRGRDQFDKSNFSNDIPDFGRLIMSTRDTLKTVEEPTDRFKLIGQMMVGMDVQTQTDTEASVMFHESIVAPMQVLTTITNMLIKYQLTVRQWNAPALYASLVNGLKFKGGLLNDTTKSLWAPENIQTLESTSDFNSRIIDKNDRSAVTKNLLRTGVYTFPKDFMGFDAKTLDDLIKKYDSVRDGKWKLLKDHIAEPINKVTNFTPEQHVAYCIIRWEALMKHLVGALYALTSDMGDMCEVQFQSNKVMVNHTRLQQTCMEVFSTVRTSIDKFRSVMPIGKINEYTTGDEKMGSIPWVQKNLIDNLFGDQDRTSGLNRAHTILTKSFMLLANKNPEIPSQPATYFDLSTLSRDPDKATKSIKPQPWCISEVLSELTHYNGATMASKNKTGADSANDATVTKQEPPLQFANKQSLDGVLTSQDPWEHLMYSTAGGASRVPADGFAARYDYYLQNSSNGVQNPGFRGDNNKDGETWRNPYNDNDDMIGVHMGKTDVGQGLMMKFNEVMSSYLGTFWDRTSLKIYSPLIEVPCNGPLNQEVFKMKGWPDLAGSITTSDIDISKKILIYWKQYWTDDNKEHELFQQIYDSTVNGQVDVSKMRLYNDLDPLVSNGKYVGTSAHLLSRLIKHTYEKMGNDDDLKDSHLYKEIVGFQKSVCTTIKNTQHALKSKLDEVATKINTRGDNDDLGDWFKKKDYSVIELTNIHKCWERIWARSDDGNTDGYTEETKVSSLIKDAKRTIINSLHNHKNINEGLYGLNPEIKNAVDKLKRYERGENRDDKWWDTNLKILQTLLVIGDDITIEDVMKEIYNDSIFIFHTQCWRYLFNLKRIIIGMMGKARTADTDTKWDSDIASQIDEHINILVNTYKKEEFNRFTGSIVSKMYRTVLTERINTSVIIKRDVQSTCGEVADFMGVCMKTVLTEYKQIITSALASQSGKYIQATVVATMSLEPISQEVKKMHTSYINWLNGKDSFGSCMCLSRTNAMSMLNSEHKWNVEDAINFVIERNYSIFSRYLYSIGCTYMGGSFNKTYTVLSDEQFSTMLSKHLDKTYRDGTFTDVLGEKVRVLYGNIYKQSIYNTVNKSLDGYIASKLVGFGFSNMNAQEEPTPVDYINLAITKSSYQFGVYKFNTTNGNKTNENIIEIIDKIRDVAGTTLQAAPSRELIPDALSIGKGDPVNILFASLSKALNGALTETNKSGIKINVTQSIAEVPLRMKEVMKAQLPIYNTMFSLISKKADLLKGIIKLGVGTYRMSHITGVEPPVINVHGGTVLLDVWDQARGAREYTRILDKITDASNSMCTTIQSVMNELNDAPLYLEVNENSIVNYKNRQQKLPFMPLSSMVAPLQPGLKYGWLDARATGMWGPESDTLKYSRRDPSMGYPDTSSGDPMFAFNYGTRLILQDYKTRPLIEHMPGVKDVVVKYNMVAHGQQKMEEKTYGQYMGKVVDLLRYASNTRLYASLFGADRRISDSADDRNVTVWAYQYEKSMSTIIELTTGSDTATNIAAIVSHVNTKSSSHQVSRSSSLIYNILDLNISPINIHAMRREIPLVNIHNYAYTFDSFITEIVESSYCGYENKDHTLGDKKITTHDVLAGMCRNPYIRVPRATFYSKLQRLISGKSSIDMYGYPKFISDQLWGKVLLQHTVIKHRQEHGNRNDRRIVSDGNSPNTNELISNEDGKLKIATLADEGSLYLNELGRMRFDTKFARNLFFLANVQRIMLHKINTELTKVPFPVASGVGITNRDITDYRDGETYNDLSID
jgi:hypothetical protein